MDESNAAAEIREALKGIAEQVSSKHAELRAELKEFEQQHLRAPGAYGGNYGGGQDFAA